MNKLDDLKEILKPYVPNPEQLENINSSTDFIRDLAINSADLVDIVLDIEDRYDIVINEAAMEQMLNVAGALKIVEDELSKK